MSEAIDADNLARYAPARVPASSAHVAGRAACDALVADADADYEGYWARLAREFVDRKRRSSAGPTTPRASASAPSSC